MLLKGIHTSRNVEDSGAEYNLINCGGLAQEVLEGKSFSMLPRE